MRKCGLIDGSPLYMHAKKQTSLLKGFLGEKIKSPFVVELGHELRQPEYEIGD